MIKKAKPIQHMDNYDPNKEGKDKFVGTWDIYEPKDIIAERESIAKELQRVQKLIEEKRLHTAGGCLSRLRYELVRVDE